MRCRTCGTEIPEGAGYCPMCGNMTPYHTAVSGENAPDTTMASFSTPAAPYSTPQPFFTPPPPPPSRRRGSVGRAILLVVLVSLIVSAGGIFFLRKNFLTQQTSPQASPTQQAQQATATPTLQATQVPQATATPAVLSPQEVYNQVTQGTPVLDEPLATNDSNNWAESTSGDGKSKCQFAGGGYHAIAQAQNMYMLCVASGTNFGDMAYQVQMTIVKGDFGGIVFRTDGSQAKYYSFFIDRSGTYTLITSVDNTGNNDYVLHKGSSSLIKKELNQVNLLAIIARGSDISLYINQQFVVSANDSSYKAGQIGVFGGTTNAAQADVVFRHVQVWNV